MGCGCECCAATSSTCFGLVKPRIKATPEFTRLVEEGVKALSEKATRVALHGLQNPTFTVTPVAHQFAAPPEVTATVQLERVDEAVQTLQQPAFFTQGTYAQAVEWTSTTISTFLIDFLTLTDDTRYFDQFVAFYKKQPVCNLLFQQFDDQMWVVLTYLRAAAYAKNHNTKWVKPFLRRAKLFYCLVRRGWDNKTCGGGMYWGPRSTYKNAVTTELYITTSMGMYEIYHKKEMLDAAIRGWVWFKNSGMINAQGLVNDGLDNTCKNNGQTTWTYNQGIVLSGLSKLYKYTGDESLITAAQSLIDSVMSSSLVDSSGVLVETCDPSQTCNQDQWMFKGVYFEHLGYFLQDMAALDKVDINLRRALVQKYSTFVFINAAAVWNVARGTDGKFASWWASPPGATRQVSVETQGSGVSALTCALRVHELLDDLQQGGTGETQITLHD